MEKVHLQGIGKRDAVPAAELKEGMIRIYNFGYTGIVKKVIEHHGGKSMIITTEERGKEYTKTIRKTTLIPVQA